MEILRTPDERFVGLPGYPVRARTTSQRRLACACTTSTRAAATAPVVLLLHGEPSWSYLYRKLVADPRRRGPARGGARSRRLRALRQAGAPRGLQLPAARRLAARLRGSDGRCATSRSCVRTGAGCWGCVWWPSSRDWFARVVAANTFLPTGDAPPGPAFLAWRKFSQETPRFHAGGIVKGGCATPLAPEVVAAYDAPFPDDRYQAGARQFPVLVPISPDDPAAAANRAAWAELERFEKPFLTAFSDLDPITRGMETVLQAQDPRGAGPAAHHDPRRRPLPPGGPRRGARAGGGGLRAADASVIDVLRRLARAARCRVALAAASAATGCSTGRSSAISRASTRAC